MKDKPTGPFWFYRDPRGWWQLNLWILFFFASDLSFGFRLFDFGLSFSIRGIHDMPFSRRYVRTGRVVVEFLPPCGTRHPYNRVRRFCGVIGGRVLVTILFVTLMLQANAQDGRSFHELPPVENIVGGGMDLEGGSKDLKAAVWIYGIGTLATAILATNKDTRHTAAPWIAGTATMGLTMTFSLKGLKWMDRSGDLLQCGYSPKTLYESIPDSLGDDPPKRFRMPAMIDNVPIRPPGRFKHRREP